MREGQYIRKRNLIEKVTQYCVCVYSVFVFVFFLLAARNAAKGGTDMEKIRYALRKKNTIILDLYFLVLDNFNFSKLFVKSFTCNSEINDRPIYFEKNPNVVTPMLILLHI